MANEIKQENKPVEQAQETKEAKVETKKLKLMLKSNLKILNNLILKITADLRNQIVEFLQVVLKKKLLILREYQKLQRVDVECVSLL